MRQVRVLALALICLVSSWYYGLRVAPALYQVHSKALLPDFYPFWNGCRAILHGDDPYGSAATRENQIGMYGHPLVGVGETDEQQRFAYPPWATVLLLPLGLVSFSTAQTLMFWLLVILTGLSVGWWRGRWDRVTVICAVLTFASYPILFGLQLRQPTLFFAALAAASVACIRCNRLAVGGVLAGLSAGKPQVALAVCVPLLLWAAADWRSRRKFAISLGTTGAFLGIISYLLVHAWPVKWIATIRAYSRYGNSSPLMDFAGRRAGGCFRSWITLRRCL
jgi:uncharacterized membrane protein